MYLDQERGIPFLPTLFLPRGLLQFTGTEAPAECRGVGQPFSSWCQVVLTISNILPHLWNTSRGEYPFVAYHLTVTMRLGVCLLRSRILSQGGNLINQDLAEPVTYGIQT